MLNATRRRLNTWVLGTAAIVVSIGATSSSFADPYVNSCGEWTIIETGFSEEIRAFAVYLNGVEEFVITREYSDVETAVHVTVDGLFASCYFHESENVDHCDAFASLLKDPLICDGTMSIVDLMDEMFPPPPVPPTPPPHNIAVAPQPAAQEGDDLTTECVAYYHFGNAQWMCDCEEDNSYENCFDCCEQVNPEPYPGSTLPFRKVRNCNANCRRDGCTCDCAGGWFCQVGRSWCELLCVRKIILS